MSVCEVYCLSASLRPRTARKSPVNQAQSHAHVRSEALFATRGICECRGSDCPHHQLVSASQCGAWMVWFLLRQQWGSQARLHALTWLLPAVCPLANYITSLGLTALVSKMWKVIVSTYWVVTMSKWNNVGKVFSMAPDTYSCWNTATILVDKNKSEQKEDEKRLWLN